MSDKSSTVLQNVPRLADLLIVLKSHAPLGALKAYLMHASICWLKEMAKAELTHKTHRYELTSRDKGVYERGVFPAKVLEGLGSF